MTTRPESSGPALLVVSGPPGAGKSTVADLLVERYEPSALVRGDDLFTFLRRGAIPPWQPGSDQQNAAVIEAAAAACGRLAKHCMVIYDAVVGPWFAAGFLAATGLPALDLAYLLPPLAECLHRVATRTDHGFDDAEAATTMWQQFARGSLPPARVFVNPDTGADETAERIASVAADGRLRVRR